MRLTSMFLALALLVVTPFIGSTPIHAQSTGDGRVLIPCGAFTGTNFVCLNNQSSFPVTWIDCDGYHAPVISTNLVRDPQTGQIIPTIPGHDYGAVKFPKGSCRVIIVHTALTSHIDIGFDAKGTNVYTIHGW